MAAPSIAVQTVESHTEGMPTRVVLQGAPSIPGPSMLSQKSWADEHLNELREFLLREPRGHAAMFGAILLPSTRHDADFGVLFMSASGFLSMCGHGTIGVATVLVTRGLEDVSEPETEVRLDTPAGLVVVRVSVRAGKAVDATIINVPAFVTARCARVSVPDFGIVAIDVAYGGNFYAIVDVTQLGLRLELAERERLTDAGLAVIEAVREQIPIEHPASPALAELRAAMLVRPVVPGTPARNMVVKQPRYFDRSPCGTGTSARMALLHNCNMLPLGAPFIHESLLGTRFRGRLVGITTVGDRTAVIPEITGRAWITGTSEFTIDASDPFPAGFEV